MTGKDHPDVNKVRNLISWDDDTPLWIQLDPRIPGTMIRFQPVREDVRVIAGYPQPSGMLLLHIATAEGQGTALVHDLIIEEYNIIQGVYNVD